MGKAAKREAIKLSRRQSAIVAILGSVALLLLVLTALHLLWTKEDLLLLETFANPKAGLAKQLLKHERIALAKGVGPDGSDAIRVTYKGFEGGSERVVVQYPLAREVTDATLSFDVFFEDDFQWVKGGKLHGLGPKNRIAGGTAMKPDGWSARLMWLAEGAICTYIYHQDKPEKYGDWITHETFRLEKGRWYAISLHVRVNSASEVADGFLHVYVDGTRVLKHDNVRYRGNTAKGTALKEFLFSTFHGGNTPTWAPKKANGSYADVHALFDNFAVKGGKAIPVHTKDDFPLSANALIEPPTR